MYENDYMYAVERDPQYLAHFGIKGMRWGVRKAIESGNTRKLGRMYRKAQKKLAKLEKRANSGAKYARRAAALGAGAAAAGGLAAAGTGGVSRAMNAVSYGMSKGALGVGQAASRLGKAMTARGIRGGGRLQAFGQGAQSLGLKGATKVGMASNAVKTWGQGNDVGKYLGKKVMDATSGNVALNNLSTKLTGVNSVGARRALEKTSNNTIARIGAGAIGAGLAAGAGYNAYRAATTKRAARKAAQWRSEMNRAFKGTQYANGAPRQGKKRRR